VHKLAGMQPIRLVLLPALVLTIAACGGSDDEVESFSTTGAPTTEAASTGTATTETQAASTSASTAPGSQDCESPEAPSAKPDGGADAPTDELDAATTYRLRFETSCGSFTVTLDLEQGPNAAASLVALAKSGFFDQVVFHRVVPGFVIQGGDPTGTGTGGPGYKTLDVPREGSAYTQGVVAMAKSGAEPPGTSGSQFFVVTGPDAGLPAEYAIVGRVTAGLATVLKIDALGVGDGPPSIPVVIEKVTVEES